MVRLHVAMKAGQDRRDPSAVVTSIPQSREVPEEKPMVTEASRLSNMRLSSARRDHRLQQTSGFQRLRIPDGFGFQIHACSP